MFYIALQMILFLVITILEHTAQIKIVTINQFLMFKIHQIVQRMMDTTAIMLKMEYI